METRLAMIGSCVTRDVWKYLDNVPNPFFFGARTSFVSMLSPMRANIDYDSLKFRKAFDAKCLRKDNEGNTFAELVEYRPTDLFLDFIDERFDLLRLGQSYMLATAEYYLCGASEQDWAREFTTIDRLSRECTEIWLAAMRKFVHQCRVSSYQTPELSYTARHGRYSKPTGTACHMARRSG